MPAYLTAEQRDQIFQEYGGNAKNSGKTEAQIALFTHRINGLAEHLRENKKDHSCRRTLLGLVGKRKRLLRYLGSKDIQKYRDLIAKLGIRK